MDAVLLGLIIVRNRKSKFIVLCVAKNVAVEVCNFSRIGVRWRVLLFY